MQGILVGRLGAFSIRFSIYGIGIIYGVNFGRGEVENQMLSSIKDPLNVVLWNS